MWPVTLPFWKRHIFSHNQTGVKHGVRTCVTWITIESLTKNKPNKPKCTHTQTEISSHDIMWIKMLFSACQHMLLWQFIRSDKNQAVTKQYEYDVYFSSMHPTRVPSTQNSIPYSLCTELQLSYTWCGIKVMKMIFF